MSRRAALFTQADLARVFAAAKRIGMSVRVDMARGVADVVPVENAPHEATPQKAPDGPKRVIVM
ncbi:hypothetical protein EZH22_24730 [Xanthobacter dioxanivorans]|uniref:Uncharacterized protein n=1 Tax=Xanthobacter dioxanivorans TaxID=2528964 RepID=A0A974PNC1_9HYPH|nr:hypothetical protein [Xanthobacter dioxanivorans]QRG06155.1 hypothetical protein EZH22_24730 [Xanthobacter dioxanivorans]